MIHTKIKTLIDVTIGDGYIGKKTNDSYYYECGHAIKQSEYVLAKKALLESVGYTTGIRSYTVKSGKNTGKAYIHCRAFACPEIRTAHKYLYNSGVKAIDRHILRILDAQSLAYWFMDDGYAKTAKYIKKGTTRYIYEIPKTGNYGLATDSFTLKENQLIKDWLSEKFSIESTIIHSMNSWNIAIYHIESKDLFRSLIAPYIIPSMQYKIQNPHSFKDIPFVVIPA